jgi:trigger factor
MSTDGTAGESAELKVSISEITPARKSLTVEVPAGEVAEEFDKACRKYLKTLKVPGFRPGKVPLHIIKQRFGKEIQQETVESVIELTMKRAVKEAQLTPLRAPVLKEYSYNEGKSLSFTAEFDVRPKVTVVGHRDIQVRLTEPGVTDKMVAEALDTMRERAARFDPVDDRGIRPGDHALLDIEVKFAAGEGQDFKRGNLLIEIGSGGPHPELSDGLRDARPGETREFSIAYPAQHPNSDLAGRRVTYMVVVREIKQKLLPDLDDDFARDLGKFSNLEELKARVVQDLMARERRRARDEVRAEILTQLLRSNPDVAIPDALVDEEVDDRLGEIARTMALQGMDPQRAGVDWDDIREKQRESAAKNVRAMILLDAVAEQEKISLDPEALDKAVSEEAERRRQTPEAFRAKLAKDGRLQRLEQQLLREKVLDFLLTAANT